MTKLDDAIYNLLKNYYEIMDFFNNRDEAFYIYIYIYIIKRKKHFVLGALGLGPAPSIYKEQPLSFSFFAQENNPI